MNTAPIIHRMAQGTAEWFAVRMGIPTSSEFDALVTPLWRPRTGEGVETYLARKLAERWLGRPLQAWSGVSGAMAQGNILEEEAIPWYEAVYGVDVERVGFVSTADGRAGCSPDGLLSAGGIEIKCPEPHTHCRYLMAGTLPTDYAAQVQGSMWVTGALNWKFVSYCRGFPALVLTIQRNEDAMDVITDTIDALCRRLYEVHLRLLELNGGGPYKHESTL